MTKRVFFIQAMAVVVCGVMLAPMRAAGPASVAYAIRGARIHPVSGAAVDNGVVVIRDGIIENVGAGVAVPADAIVIDGTGMHVYPGFIDMANEAAFGSAGGATAGGRAGGGGGQGGATTTTFATLEEAERAKREAILHPHILAADNLNPTAPALAQLASAGVTTVLAVPPDGIFKGQSALVNVSIPPDDPQVSTIADYRRGLAVIKSPVALHVDMGARGGGAGYPGSLLGTIAFTQQAFHDAQWQRDATAHYLRTGAKGPRPIVEPALDSLRPALARQMPVAIDANLGREIDRALALAAEFKLDPIVVGASNAQERIAELAQAKARVILSLNFPGGRGGGAGAGGGGGGGRGGGGGPSLSQLQAQANAPKVPAALAQANVPFAFTSGGATAADFVRNAGRVVKEGGLPADAALRALTLEAARMAGAADRVGSIERGKIANLVVTQGDVFDGGAVRHVFIDGRPIEIETAASGAGRGGRGGGR